MYKMTGYLCQFCDPGTKMNISTNTGYTIEKFASHIESHICTEQSRQPDDMRFGLLDSMVIYRNMLLALIETRCADYICKHAEDSHKQ